MLFLEINMLENIYILLDRVLDLHQTNISVSAMMTRVFIVYVFGIIVLNVVNKRFVGERTPFDIILRFLIGSSLANAIVGSSPYFETLGMVLFIVLLHWTLSLACFYSRMLEKILKGKTEILYRHGKFNWQLMRKYHLTQEDIMSEVRKDAGLTKLKEVKEIFVEDSGEISIIPLKDKTVHATEDLDD